MNELYGLTPRPARRIFGTRELNLNDDAADSEIARQPTADYATNDAGLLVPCKTITVHPIWAWAIVRGFKRVENRSWPTQYRGRLAIHAGTNRKTESADRLFVERLGLRVPGGIAGRAIIGTVDLVACQPYAGEITDDPWACGPWCWILENPRCFFEPIPASGKLSFWTSQIPAALLR